MGFGQIVILALAPAILTGIVTIFLNRLDREKNSGQFAGTVESALASTQNAIGDLRSHINQRLDEIRDSQTRQWQRIDIHNREIGRLQGRVESLACMNGKKPGPDGC